MTGVALPAAGDRIDARQVLTLAAHVADRGDVVLIRTHPDGATTGDIIVVTPADGTGAETLDGVAVALVAAGGHGWLVAVDDERSAVRHLSPSGEP